MLQQMLGMEEPVPLVQDQSGYASRSGQRDSFADVPWGLWTHSALP